MNQKFTCHKISSVAATVCPFPSSLSNNFICVESTVNVSSAHHDRILCILCRSLRIHFKVNMPKQRWERFLYCTQNMHGDEFNCHWKFTMTCWSSRLLWFFSDFCLFGFILISIHQYYELIDSDSSIEWNLCYSRCLCLFSLNCFLLTENKKKGLSKSFSSFYSDTPSARLVHKSTIWDVNHLLLSIIERQSITKQYKFINY